MDSKALVGSPTDNTGCIKKCAGCKVRIFDYIIMVHDLNDLSVYLRQHGLLPCHIYCEKCGGKCVLHFAGPSPYFSCNRRACAFNVSAIRGTFFSETQLNVAQICELVMTYLTLYPPRVRNAMVEMKLSMADVMKSFRLIREVLHKHTMTVEKIGGPGVIVEVSETNFSMGYFGSREQWAVGGVIRGMKTHVFLDAVPDRRAETLTAIIDRHVAPGSIIVTKNSVRFNALQAMGFTHLIAKRDFGDRRTGAHVQNIVRLWREVKRRFPKNGVPTAHFCGYLADAMFRIMHPGQLEIIHHFWEAVAKLYPGLDHCSTS